MARAEKNFKAKVARQSSTLEEAVLEYERRYHLRPPKGFDKWFRLAKKKGYIMIDEFDSVYHSLVPFLSYPPSLLRERAKKLQFDTEFWMQQHTFTLVFRNGKRPQVFGPMKNTNTRPAALVDFYSTIEEDIPDMNVTFTGHDQPWVVLSGEAKEAMAKAVKAGTYLDEKYREDPHDNWDYDGWQVICPPNSPLRAEPKFDSHYHTYPPYPPSFISDHAKTMDFCNQPNRQHIHGFTSWEGPRPGLLYPIYAFTSSAVHSDFPAVPLEQWDLDVGVVPSWENKTYDMAVWRGSTTGVDFERDGGRFWAPRLRLVKMQTNGSDATFPFAPDDTSTQVKPMKTFSTSYSEISKSYFDIKFSGEPAQCKHNTCQVIRSLLAWDTERMSADTSNKYKYVIDVDGNGWSGRFHRLLSSNSVVLKSTWFPEWYQEIIEPWLHYVPVSIDYNDIWTIMAFFKGDADGKGGHDHLAKKIAEAGRQWAADHWKWSDMQVYAYRQLLEYNRLINRDDEDPRNMDY